MSQEELVNAYVEGRVSRRTLIRRLVAGGISLGAAVSYAHLLSPEQAAARPRLMQAPDYYPDLNIHIKSDSLKDIIDSGRLKVRVRSSGKAKLRLRGYVKDGGSFVKIGERDITFHGAGRQTYGIDVKTGRLRHRNKAELKATVDGRGDYHGAAADTKTLS
jgi:hypothetical protein